MNGPVGSQHQYYNTITFDNLNRLTVEYTTDSNMVVTGSFDLILVDKG